MALGTPVPWHGSGVATFVHRQSTDSHAPDGFIQARKRLGRPEAELCYLAPSLEADPSAVHTWRALLEHLVAHAGEYGIQRLYACLPAQDEAASLLAEGGFALYVRETLFVLRETRSQVDATLAPFIRPQREADSFSLQRLADRFTPPVVLKAEGVDFKNGGGNHALIFQNWWQPDHADGLVLERDGALEGAVIIQRGSRGVWLRYLGDPLQRDVVEALMVQSLARFRPNDKVVYCSVRAYQSGLGASLHDLGFEGVAELARFVKHVTVRVQEPAVSKTRLLIETTFPGVISSKMPDS